MSTSVVPAQPTTNGTFHPLRLAVTHPDADSVLVRVEGDLDHETSPRLRELLHERVHAAIRSLEIDLTRVSFVSSAGLGALERAYLLARERGIDVTVHPPAATPIRRLMTTFPLRFAAAFEAA
ncbi:STAS domain-containing protein [Amycolatopsis sp. NPDC004368]